LIKNDILQHPQLDSGVRTGGVQLARIHSEFYRHCLIVFDWYGSGAKDTHTEEKRIKDELAKSGWEEKAEVIIINPELEIWIWGDSSHIPKILGWKGWDDLREWLIEKEYFKGNQVKPDKPKEALKDALRKKGKRFSSAIHKKVPPLKYQPV